MIDTVVLRIHNLSKYPLLHEQYHTPSKKKGSYSRAYVNADTGEYIEDTFTASTIYHDSGKILPLVFYNSLSLPSSHYSLAYSVNPNLDYLEFNFSLPKYCYGNNVMQFLFLYDTSPQSASLLLFNFLKSFMHREFNQPVLLDDVEINRIDLCYNQFFNCKEDALSYLKEQKSLIEKYSNKQGSRGRDYGSTVMYKTDRYSFKVYHKGLEFKEHDFKQITKNGNKMGLDCQFLQEQADCILRYEMTFRASAMRYVFNQFFLDSRAKLDYHEYASYRPGRLIRQLANVDSNFTGHATKGRRSFFEIFKRRAKKFTLKTVFDYTSDLHTIKDSDALPFDTTFFCVLHKVFWQKVKDYQFETAVSIADMRSKIEEVHQKVEIHNKLVGGAKKRKMNSSRVLPTALLLQHVSFQDLRQLLPKSTYYDMKRDLEKIGLTENSSKVSIPKPPMDYCDYKMYFAKYHEDNTIFHY